MIHDRNSKTRASTNSSSGPLRRFSHGAVAVMWTALLFSTPGVGAAASSSEQQRLVEESTLTFERFLEQPGLAAWHLTEAKNAKGVLIVPRFLEGARRNPPKSC